MCLAMLYVPCAPPIVQTDPAQLHPMLYYQEASKSILHLTMQEEISKKSPQLQQSQWHMVLLSLTCHCSQGSLETLVIECLNNTMFLFFPLLSLPSQVGPCTLFLKKCRRDSAHKREQYAAVCPCCDKWLRGRKGYPTWGRGRNRRGLGLPRRPLLGLTTRPGVFQKLGNASVGQAGRALTVLG